MFFRFFTTTTSAHQHKKERRGFSKAEYTLTLRLTSKLVDLQVGYVNPIRCRAPSEFNSCVGYTNAKSTLSGAFLMHWWNRRRFAIGNILRLAAYKQA